MPDDESNRDTAVLEKASQQPAQHWQWTACASTVFRAAGSCSHKHRSCCCTTLKRLLVSCKQYDGYGHGLKEVATVAARLNHSISVMHPEDIAAAATVSPRPVSHGSQRQLLSAY
jgi:hypothetical protein